MVAESVKQNHLKIRVFLSTKGDSINLKQIREKFHKICYDSSTTNGGFVL